MSFFASFTKKAKLDAAVKKAVKARKEEGGIADQLLKEVYQDYADVLIGDSFRAKALYHWGVTLLHQAKSKTPPESINIYRNAIAKFAFCMTIDPSYLAAAIDAGVACMDLARARGVPPSDELYEMAKKQFEKANSIQAGVATFNLACVYGIRGDNENCLEALQTAKGKGNLPEDADILADPDLANIKNQAWFQEFMSSLEEDRRLEEEKRLAAKAAEEEAKKPKPKEKTEFDPYRTPKKKVEEKKNEPEAKADEPEVIEEAPAIAEKHVEQSVANTEEAIQTPVEEVSVSAIETPKQSNG
ncbi:TPR end-of-group domain-containing protein [Methyloglobulus sp.]|uniref:TPR end-of-group domain-containing protein n=1 Tax=Methyloglobulus sp. TaxID=2518622 RepID=UPI003988E227